MKVKVEILNAFSENSLGGNPAGVVIDSKHLSKDQMQKIAKSLGLSEVAFVQKSTLADFKIRFFTPNAEIDLCGHATIAAFSALKKFGFLSSTKYTQQTNSGVLSIEIKKDGSVLMEQNLPKFFQKISAKEISSSLNIPLNFLDLTLPIQIVSTGLKDIIVPIKNLSKLNSIKPNFEKISLISKKYDAVGYHLFACVEKENITASCRNFAPLYDIPEEAATGTSSGALGCYLFQNKKIDERQASKLLFTQGISMGKSSKILVKLKVSQNKISKVRVGGGALWIEQKEVKL